MSSFFPTTVPTTTGLTLPPGLQCVSGVVNLFQFFTVPAPGSVIGTLTTVSGNRINLVQTQPTPLGGTPLSSVDGRFATLCGVFVTATGGQIALDVRIVNPGAPSPTGTPVNIDLRTVLALLLIVLGQPVLQNLVNQPEVRTLVAQLQSQGINIGGI